MRVVEFDRERSRSVEGFDSVGTASAHLGSGHGDAHAYCLYFEAGGSIGRHPAGFGQLLIVVQGEGWASGEDGRRVPIAEGQAAHFARGEMHAKGSDSGMTAIMLQVRELDPSAS